MRLGPVRLLAGAGSKARRLEHASKLGASRVGGGRPPGPSCRVDHPESWLGSLALAGSRAGRSVWLGMLAVGAARMLLSMLPMLVSLQSQTGRRRSPWPLIPPLTSDANEPVNRSGRLQPTRPPAASNTTGNQLHHDCRLAMFIQAWQTTSRTYTVEEHL